MPHMPKYLTDPSVAEDFPFYTVKQAAFIAGFASVAAFYLRLRDPEYTPMPTFIRRGRLYLFPKKEFDEWATQKEIP